MELTSKPNWDDEGALVISPIDWYAAIDFANAVEALVPNAPPPFFSAGGEASIYIGWTGAERRIELELRTSSLSRWAYWFMQHGTKERQRHSSDITLYHDHVMGHIKKLFEKEQP